MAKTDKTTLDLMDPAKPAVITSTEVIAAGLSVVWLTGSLIFFWILGPSSQDTDGLIVLMLILAVILPIAMIWVAASAARSLRIVRQESERLQSVIDGMRQTYIREQQMARMKVQPPQKPIEAIEKIKSEGTPVAFSSTRAQPDVLEQEGDQALLELDVTHNDPGPPLETDDLIRALHFPEDTEDELGFTSLRRAMKNPRAGKLVRSAQDILTLLSQEGIYMDDLKYDRARPEIWRRFAEGERGPVISALGGVHDRSSLALASKRMREDPVFRDTAHHFLRLFDKMLLDFSETATDAEIARLSITRTAIAFMLLGRVTGTFS
ncbi:hypothetical protein [Parasulfitobacter algicola]|uniref:Uncharacterized protein n=1 Tax=Parasulfitobacter algicola TaxID=2614809 RepID=A0ABX2ISQ3_9RHOB|nr:hypothetical protein [Sulfitobacter algicola]NSX53827.1 hypothetical protein [Sulfitobacter algicola]